MELTELLVNKCIDAYVYWWLNVYFSKYKVPEQAGDVEKFIRSFSLNGICGR